MAGQTDHAKGPLDAVASAVGDQLKLVEERVSAALERSSLRS